jgi:hypothetical protein
MRSLNQQPRPEVRTRKRAEGMDPPANQEVNHGPHGLFIRNRGYYGDWHHLHHFFLKNPCFFIFLRYSYE